MQQPGKTSKRASSALWRWPVIFLLSLLWAVAALVALIFGAPAKAAHAVAEACATAIQVLRETER